MLRHTPRVRKAVYFMAFLSIGLGLFTILFSYGYLTYQQYQGKRDCEAWLAETALELVLDARLTDIEVQGSCEEIWQLNQEGPDQIRICTCQADKGPAFAVQIGDSLHKPAGTLYIEHYRPGRVGVESFSYPCCK